MFALLLTLWLAFSAFPWAMRREYGKRVGWRCERCGKRFRDGWMIEFHHRTPTSAGGKSTWDNIEALCIEDHYHAHLELRRKGIGDPRSAGIVYARWQKTGGRTREWIEAQNSRKQQKAFI